MKLKKNFIIIGIEVVLMILISGISVYATVTYYANQVTYKNGKTVEQALNELYASRDNRLYLYWKGNTFDSVTGGWESSVVFDAWAKSPQYNFQVYKKDAVFNTDHIDLSTDSTLQYVVANTKNKIDCTGYNYINIYYIMSSAFYTRVRFASRIDSGIYGVGADAPLDMDTDLPTQSNLRLLTIPISGVDSEYIFINTLRGNSSDPATDLKIYGVFLSKNIDP